MLVNCSGLHSCPVDKPSPSTDLQGWRQAYALSFPVVSDQSNATQIFNYSEKDKTTDFPAGYIVDQAGIIRNRFKGFDRTSITLR